MRCLPPQSLHTSYSRLEKISLPGLVTCHPIGRDEKTLDPKLTDLPTNFVGGHALTGVLWHDRNRVPVRRHEVVSLIPAKPFHFTLKKQKSLFHNTFSFLVFHTPPTLNGPFTVSSYSVVCHIFFWWNKGIIAEAREKSKKKIL